MSIFRKKKEPIFHMDEIEIDTLPRVKVAVFDRMSREPEQEASEMAKQWLAGRGLTPDCPGVRLLGFDNYDPDEMIDNRRRYMFYVTLPPELDTDNDNNVKMFNGGRYAKLMIEDPFTGDFPSGWDKLIGWAKKHGYTATHLCKWAGKLGRCWHSTEEKPKRCGGTCWCSCEQTPCFEEIVDRDGVRYMDFYLPIL